MYAADRERGKSGRDVDGAVLSYEWLRVRAGLFEVDVDGDRRDGGV
jgi:hypothetical protein